MSDDAFLLLLFLTAWCAALAFMGWLADELGRRGV